jgi:hypothetical protein
MERACRRFLYKARRVPKPIEGNSRQKWKRIKRYNKTPYDNLSRIYAVKTP